MGIIDAVKSFVRGDKDNSGIPSERRTQSMSFVPQKQWVDTRTITLDVLDELYDRNGLAHKIVEVMADKTFNKWYEVIHADDKVVSEVEALDRMKGVKFRTAYKKAYKLRWRHGYSLIFLGYEDAGSTPADPVVNPVGIKQLEVFSCRAVKEWIYEGPMQTGAITHVILAGQQLGMVQDVKIHMSRIQIIGDALNGRSIFIAAYNWLNVFDNNVWAMGQSYYRYASGFPFLKISGATDDEFTKAEAMWRNVTARTGLVGDERYDLDFKGAEGSALPIRDYYECGLKAVALAIDMPFALLEGATAGAVTGSETNSSELYDKIISIQHNEVEPDVLDTYELFWIAKVISTIDFEIEWCPLWPMDEQENANILKTKSEAYQIGVNLGAMSKNEFRRALEIKNILPDHEYDIEGGDEYKTAAPPSPFGQAPNDPAQGAPPASNGGVPPSSSPPNDQKDGRSISSDGQSKLEDNPAIEKVVADATVAFAKLYDWAQLNRAINGLTTADDLRKDDNQDEFLQKLDLIIDSNEADMRFTVDKIAKDAFGLGVANAVQETGYGGELSPDTANTLSAFKGSLFQIVKGVNGDVKRQLRNRLIDELAKTGGSNLTDVRNALREELDALRDSLPANRLQVIARTETNRAFNNANYAVYKDAGVVKVMAITARDDRVRPEHAAVDGQVVAYGKPFSNGYTRPPFGPNCRCSLIPIVG